MSLLLDFRLYRLEHLINFHLVISRHLRVLRSQPLKTALFLTRGTWGHELLQALLMLRIWSVGDDICRHGAEWLLWGCLRKGLLVEINADNLAWLMGMIRSHQRLILACYSFNRLLASLKEVGPIFARLGIVYLGLARRILKLAQAHGAHKFTSDTIPRLSTILSFLFHIDDIVRFLSYQAGLNPTFSLVVTIAPRRR